MLMRSAGFLEGQYSVNEECWVHAGGNHVKHTRDDVI